MNQARSPLDSLKPLAGRALEAALNRALALDPETRDGLRALDGRSVSLHLAAPPLGVQVANAIAAALRHARGAAGEFAATAAEYVTEESRDVVPRDELNAFHDDVDTLRDDVERTAARVARLLARGGPSA